MSRRNIAFVLVALASLAVSACGNNPTGPSRDDSTGIVVSGSGG